MTAETLAMIAAALLSLGFSYIPGLSTWYAALEDTAKKLLMLVLLVLIAAAAYGLACAGWGADFGLALTCDRAGLVGLLRALALAIIGNQSIYAISPRSRAVAAVKAARAGLADLSLGRG